METTQSRYRIHGPDYSVITRIKQDVELAKLLGYKVTNTEYE